MSDLAAEDIRNADELGQYRSLSISAVLGLCLGISSPLVLASPLWTILPVAGITVSILALGKIHAAAGSLTGIRLAKAGLALSVLSLVVPMSKDYIRDSIAVDKAGMVAEQWISEISAGNSEAAALMVLPQKLYDITAKPSAPGSPDPPTYTLEDGIAKFARIDEIELISQQESPRTVSLDRSQTVIIWKPRYPEIRLSYELGLNTDNQALHCTILLMRRTVDQDTELWFIKDWSVVPHRGA